MGNLAFSRDSRDEFGSVHPQRCKVLHLFVPGGHRVMYSKSLSQQGCNLHGFWQDTSLWEHIQSQNLRMRSVQRLDDLSDDVLDRMSADLFVKKLQRMYAGAPRKCIPSRCH
eukprot:TRINITY_DN2810_c0_g1::TRINITY_DN2810_c0_g1_i1::g.5292::m.5292 TRINITY_DN2810_c0_g1::TRINITY_DN2810_c0_g1_i1::g.5292  ORF type:complete len:112 (-),score=-8.58,DUF1127/PF06568.6/0.19 TRINITY_DN2810_c0_g1_i1:626-961(-)